MKPKKSVILLAVVPTIIFLLSIGLYASRGPHYLGYNSDPEYVYLLNSLNILDLKAPNHTDHPGTTLQALSALVILVKWSTASLLGSTASLQDSVLTNPEDYLQVINKFLNLLICIATFLAGLKLYHIYNRLAPAITLQLSLLLFVTIIEELRRVRPEPLLVFTALMLGINLIPIVFANSDNQSSKGKTKKAILAGIILGFGVATKVTFAPLFGVVLLFQGLKKKALVIFSSFVAFIIFTLPILTQYPRLISWFVSIFVHKGTYGRGEQGLLELDILTGNLKKLYIAEPLLFVLLGFYLFLGVFLTLYKLKDSNFLSKKIRNLLLVGCLIITVQIIITAKYPGPGVHYMLPAMVLTGLLNASIVFLFLKLNQKQLRIRYSIIAIIAALVFIAGIGHNLIRMNNAINIFENNLHAEKEILYKIKEMKRCHVFQYYRASSVASSLNFGNSFVEWKYRDKLAHLFPKALFYNIWGGSFHTIRGKRIIRAGIQDALNKNRCFLLYGISFEGKYSKLQRDLILEPIIKNKRQALYKLVGFRK